jgi:hypothetical protein
LGWLVLPADPSSQVEDDGRVVRLFPALGQVGLDRERPRWYRGADLVADELAVDEAQRATRLEVDREVRIEVRRIVPAHAVGPATLWRLGTE